MEIIFSDNAADDLSYWKQTKNEKILKRIKQLIIAIQNEPFKGIGKPEPLKHSLSGMWSRRINREHRLIYELQGNSVIVHALKEHY